MRGMPTRRPAFSISFGLFLAAASIAGAQEMTVQNDSLTDGSSGVIQAGFDPGESAASWMTAPCTGSIVAVQVLWRSLTGTAPADIEDSIKVFNGGAFPTPGAELASVDGPFMTDGVFNEFRFLDENMVIPLDVPVTSGQTYVVSFKFLNDPSPATGPSVVNDSDGCQNGKNTINANGIGWISSCLLGVGGDWVIRSIVDCAASGGSGSIPDGGDVPGVPLRLNLVGNQLELTWGDSCEPGDADYGVYAGFLGAYYSHFSKFCTTGGATSTTFAIDGFNRYYLVVPFGAGQEGSYGRDGGGSERPQGGGACQTVQAISCP